MSARSRDLFLLLLLTAALGVPFLDKPFHIDDPFILGISANILEDPLDPFAGNPRSPFSKVDSLVFEPRIPIRAMHPAGASFYAMYSKRPHDLPSLPYRLLPNYPLERFDIYVRR